MSVLDGYEGTFQIGIASWEALPRKSGTSITLPLSCLQRFWSLEGVFTVNNVSCDLSRVVNQFARKRQQRKTASSTQQLEKEES